MLCRALEIWPRVVGRLHIGPKMTDNGPKSSVLEFNQNRVINIGWNLFQMIYIVLYHPVQIRYLEKLQKGTFWAKIGKDWTQNEVFINFIEFESLLLGRITFR